VLVILCAVYQNVVRSSDGCENLICYSGVHWRLTAVRLIVVNNVVFIVADVGMEKCGVGGLEYGNYPQLMRNGSVSVQCILLSN